MERLKTEFNSNRIDSAKQVFAVLLSMAVVGCGGSKGIDSEELERRRGASNSASPQPKPVAGTSSSSSKSLEKAAMKTVASAVSLSSSSIDAGSSSQENSAAQSPKKLSGNSAVNYSFACPGGGTGAASGSRTREGTETSFASLTTADLQLDSCTTQSYEPESSGIVFDGMLKYSRVFQVSQTELLAETTLNGSLSSTQSGVELCSVTYDNLEVHKYLSFETGEISNTVTGTVVANCTGTDPSPTPTEAPVATPTPTPTSGGGPNPSSITVLCSFTGVPITSLPATVDVHCEIAE